jgi:hypothetical protein
MRAHIDIVTLVFANRTVQVERGPDNQFTCYCSSHKFGFKTYKTAAGIEQHAKNSTFIWKAPLVSKSFSIFERPPFNSIPHWQETNPDVADPVHGINAETTVFNTQVTPFPRYILYSI